MKLFSAVFLGCLFLGTTYLTGIVTDVQTLFRSSEKTDGTTLAQPPTTYSTPDRQTDVSDLVTKALYFKGLLTSTQQSTLQQTYTTTLARKWSNLPCGSGCRNGIQFSALNSAQLGAALEVVKAALSTSYSNQGAAEFYQIRLADWVLSHQYAGGSGYDSTIYFMAFLNTPSTTGGWMLQFGGHHFACNLAFNGGKEVGPTPQFRGVEPTSFTVGGTTYTPLSEERTALQAMLASFSSAELATAKLSTTYSDVLLSPGESNGNTNAFPTAKAGIAVSTLNATKQALVLAALEPYLQDLDDASAAVLRTQYANGISGTYVAWTGSGTAGTASTFLNANTNYVRIDGPRVWIEFICQNGVVVSNQIHYHTVFRDHTNDYGADLTLTALPAKLASFEVKRFGDARSVSWNTATEEGVDHFEIERSEWANGPFKTIYSQTAKNAAAGYSFNDAEIVASAVLYYRLKTIDAGGQSTYSNTVAVRNASIKTVAVYPNPARNTISVLPANELSNATITIADAQGKTVLNKANQTGSKIDLDIAFLPTGTYYLQVKDEDKAFSAGFIKK